ncbi:putative inactive group IIC secretory phospholipase A2 isoform X1 [Castor canadensis]|uniref:Inactive group IIC secretory phospholipase A2 isoform X1 n=2 Tax=Castor canadensis TaxID=51338 RepID=A0AC58N6F0_CASCN
MKVISILIVFICLTIPTFSSFWQFQRMVKHITGRSAFFSYYGYGCYCGLGGKGIPVDDTDRCCRAHDCCYKKLKEIGCQPVLNSYPFHIVNSTVVCCFQVVFNRLRENPASVSVQSHAPKAPATGTPGCTVCQETLSHPAGQLPPIHYVGSTSPGEEAHRHTLTLPNTHVCRTVHPMINEHSGDTHHN